MSKRVETSLVSVIITSQLYVKVNVQVVNHGILGWGVGGGAVFWHWVDTKLAVPLILNSHSLASI